MSRLLRKTQAFPKMMILANLCDNFILMTDNDIYSAFTLYKICLPPVFPSSSSLFILEAKLKNKLFMCYNYKITKEKRYIALKNFLFLEN
jgi:hypothetical protein